MTDVEDIQRILALYCQYADDGRLDDFLGLWRADGTMHLSERSARGHAEIREVVASSPRPSGQLKHLVLNCAIHVSTDGHSAEVTSDFVTLTADGGGINVGWAGRNQDRFAKSDASWLIVERRITGRL